MAYDEIGDENLNDPLMLDTCNFGPRLAVDYVGVSYGATRNLFSFWDKHEFTPVYLSNSQVISKF